MSTPDDFPWYEQSQRGLRLWVHWKPLNEHLEEAFTQHEKWGVQGLMVDFLDRDDQEMVLFAKRVLQSAARHHLHIHFHGVWKPTGLQHTYPNLYMANSKSRGNGQFEQSVAVGFPIIMV